MNERDELIEEVVLRRSLRLESDERMPRFDPIAIAAMAARERPSARAMLLTFAATALTGVIAVLVWTTIAELAPAVLAPFTDALVDALIALATIVVPVAEAAAQPAVPLSLLAALGVAIAHELRERKEHAHAHAS